MEARATRRASRIDCQEELGLKQPVPLVARFAGEVELGREDPPAPRLDLDVEMPSAARVETRHDGREPVAALGIRILVAAAPEPFVVVLPVVVGVPEVE